MKIEQAHSTMSQILNLSDEREVVENCVNSLEDLSYFEKNCKALSDTDGMIEGFTRVLKAGIVAEGDNLQGGSLFLDPPLLGLEGRISMLGAIVNISYYGDDSVKATLFHSPGLMACLVRILLMAGLGQEVSEENVITLDEGSRVAGAELPVAVIGAEAIRKEASDYEREGTRMDGVGVWVVTVILNISCCDEVRMRLVEKDSFPFWLRWQDKDRAAATLRSENARCGRCFTLPMAQLTLGPRCSILPGCWRVSRRLLDTQKVTVR